MQKFNSADNPQVIADLAWLAGCLDSDGCVTIARIKQNKYHKNFTWRPMITWANGNELWIEEIARILEEQDIPHYVHWRVIKGTPHAQVMISGYKRVAKALPILRPYVRAKKRQLNVLRQFLGVDKHDQLAVRLYEKIHALNH